MIQKLISDKMIQMRMKNMFSKCTGLYQNLFTMNLMN